MSAMVTLGLLVGAVALAASVLARPPGRSLPAVEHRTGSLRRPSLGAHVGRVARAFARQQPDPASDRRVGRCLLAAAGAATVHLGAAALVLVGCWVASIIERRRHRAQRVGDIADGVADVIDLFAVSLLSGNNIAVSITQVGVWIRGELGAGFQQCARQIERGRTVADALEELPERLGPQVRPLVGALVASERHGASITNHLAQLAADSRADRRRRAEAAARRLPVALLFPLVTCVLPAFLLVTVVPAAIDTLSTFDILASP